jgi:uncharacterized DUF497 family protein
MDFPQRREHPADGGFTEACFTLRGDGTLIRVISARDMHRKERSVYDQAR